MLDKRGKPVMAGERPATLEISECSKATGGRELSRTYIVSDAEMAAFARFVESLYLGQWATEETLGDDLREATTLSLWYSPRLHPVTLSDAGALPPGVSQTIDRIREVMERHAKPSRLVEG